MGFALAICAALTHCLSKSPTLLLFFRRRKEDEEEVSLLEARLLMSPRPPASCFDVDNLNQHAHKCLPACSASPSKFTAFPLISLPQMDGSHKCHNPGDLKPCTLDDDGCLRSLGSSMCFSLPHSIDDLCTKSRFRNEHVAKRISLFRQKLRRTNGL